jgi:hypothetical protein
VVSRHRAVRELAIELVWKISLTAGGPPDPWTWQLAEMFKIEKGKIRQIEAVLQRVPYGMNSGWSNWEDGLSSAARDVTKSGGR